MSFDTSASFLWGIGALVLALSALTARRLSVGAVVRSLLSWVVIAGLAYLIITHRHELGQMFTDLGERVGIEEQSVEGDTVRIRQSGDGHFWARVSLNGVERRMLIDSGATMTALSERTAQAAGVAANGLPVILTTANGTVPARSGSLQRLELGTLETEDLPVVISATFGDFDVIGMNFLSRLGSWRVEGRTLILEPKRDAAERVE